jgi:hypothetical protein
MQVAVTALDNYLEHIRFGNCTINAGYLQALGLSASPEGEQT